MSEKQIKDENYYMVHGWMINRLGLKGVQLNIYAIIHGFTQDGESEFRGSLQYLCDFTGSSKPTVIKALKELVENGHLKRRDEIINGVQFPRYKAVLLSEHGSMGGSKETLPPVKNLNQGGKETLPGGGKETLPPTLDNNNKDITIDRGDIVPTPPQVILDLYNYHCPSLTPAQYLTQSRKEAIQEATSKYTFEQFARCFQIAEASSFLKGTNPRKWKATIDWLIDVNNIAKVLEGNFTDGAPQEQAEHSFDLDEFFNLACQRGAGLAERCTTG